MTTGVHLVVYSKNAEADKAFFRDVLKLTNIDVGHGWLIFGLPPSELAVHPAATNGQHEIYLLCDDIKAFVMQMTRQKIVCGEIQNQGWGQLVQLTLPSGGKIGVYQPRHARPEPMKIKKEVTKAASKSRGKRKADKKKSKTK